MSADGPLRLIIEASTAAGSVALFRGHDLLGVRHVTLGSGANDVLYPAIVSVCADAAVAPRQLARIVCGEGPGSFTSLRIAASLAKGVAQGAGVPLAAVSSLLIAAATPTDLPAGRYAVHADALRGERFVQWVDVHPSGVTPFGPPQRLAIAQLKALTSEGNRLAVLASPEALPDRIVVPSAEAFARLAPSSTGDVLVATWEPLYGRLAEAQVQWEQRHGEPLPVVLPTRS